MSDKKTFILAHAEARRRVCEFANAAPDGWHVTFRPPTRSLDQNARMWAMLGEVAKQVMWHGRKLTPESWKCIFSASLKKQDVVPGLHGDFVVIGQSTSQMTKQEFSDMIELIYLFGAEQNIEFRDEILT